MAGREAERDHVIAIRKTDILDELIAGGQLRDDADREAFRQVTRLLASIFHYEYFEWLEKLRHSYFYFDPEVEPPAKFDDATMHQAYADLVAAFETVIKGANFAEVSRDEIEMAHREDAAVQVEIRANHDEMRDVRFFKRGHHMAKVMLPRWFGLRRREGEALCYDDVILLAAMKPRSEFMTKRELKRLSQRMIRPGAVLIKYFRNIAAADLNALYPNARVVLGWRDRVILTVPALAGAIPVLMNVVSTVTVLFVVLGFYLGVRGTVEDDEMKQALAALSALVAFGAFVMRQWVKYQRQSLRHQKQLSDTVYYRNISNNSGIFDYVIGAAEEQETKEAFLAYYFLATAETAPTQQELDRTIEDWLMQRFGADVDFEADDALAKLDRLGLLMRDGETLTVLPLTQALMQLDAHWDAYFSYGVKATQAQVSVVP